jgi:putative phosphoesterase
MRVGLLSDIHANLPALNAVLDDLPADLDAICCAGDIVGYSAWPAECVERVREVCDVVVRGNHDREVDNPDSYSGNEMARAGLKHAKAVLSAEQRSWVTELPPVTEAFDERLLLVHSHPENTDRYVSKGMFTSVGTHMSDQNRVLALGHTHQQAAINMARFDRHGWVVNPGSVGQPRDGNPKAAYAVVDLAAPTVDLHRVSYPIGEVKSAHEDVGLPREAADRLEDAY